MRAVQLRTANLATKGLPYIPAGERKCRTGCDKIESLAHVLQACPTTHYERIKRHNSIVAKVARHCRRKGWTTEVEPRVRHVDGQLFIPDLAVHQPNSTLTICDVQVCWESTRTLAESWDRKRLVYDNFKFREAAARKWPNLELEVLPLLLGARGVWPRCNSNTTNQLNITAGLRASCVHSCLKWGSSIHNHFMASTWRRRPPPEPPPAPRR